MDTGPDMSLECTDDVSQPKKRENSLKLSNREAFELEQKLEDAESNVLRYRAQLGYSASNHLAPTSERLSKLAQVVCG